MASRVDVRVSDKIKNQVDSLQNKMNKPFPDTVRELLEIGIFVKEKQLSDNGSNKENWEEYFKKTALRTMESRGILASIYRTVFDKNKSQYDSADDEIRAIMTKAKAGMNKVVGLVEDDI